MPPGGPWPLGGCVAIAPPLLGCVTYFLDWAWLRLFLCYGIANPWNELFDDIPASKLEF